MKVKITKSALFIPPFISTSWHHISSLQANDGILKVSLIEGDTVSIPNLPEEVITRAFTMHLAFIEHESRAFEQSKDGIHSFMLSPANLEMVQHLPLKMGFGDLDAMGNPLQHNPEQANLPEIPKEVLQKIGAIASIVNPEWAKEELPETEPHCNCYSCQLSRAMTDMKHLPGEGPNTQDGMEVLDEELKFQQWEILPVGEKQFKVINRLDEAEEYTVFLGTPVGCTCGKKNCDHLIAVLQS